MAGETTTESTTTQTSEAEGKNTEDVQTGKEVTQTSTTTEVKKTETTDPQVTSALKVLEEAGLLGKDVLTKAQHDGHMGAARRQWQAEADRKAQEAAQEADRKAKEEQGQFKPLYEQVQSKVTTLEAENTTLKSEIEGWRTRENKRIDEAVKNLPAVIKEFDPGPDNFTARMEWYDKVQKHAGELQGRQLPGGGYTPSPNGTRPTREVTAPVSRSRF